MACLTPAMPGIRTLQLQTYLFNSKRRKETGQLLSFLLLRMGELSSLHKNKSSDDERVCLNSLLSRSCWNGWNGTRAVRIRSSPFQPVLCPMCERVNSGPPTRTDQSSTDSRGGRSRAARLRGRGTVTWAAIAPDTENSFTRTSMSQGKPHRRRCQPPKWYRRDRSRGCDVDFVWLDEG